MFGRIFHNFALKMMSVSLGAIIYYIVIQLVLTLGFDANLLKLLSASVAVSYTHLFSASAAVCTAASIIS